MTVRERMLAIKLMDRVKENPMFTEEIGLMTKMKTNKENLKNGGKLNERTNEEFNY